MKGKIVKFFSFRGFGFIEPENSQENIFFHISNFPKYVQPEIGQQVEFEETETPKGKEAVNVKLVTETITVEVEADEKEAEKAEASILKLSEIKGVGKVTEAKLSEAGYDSVESIISADAQIVSERTGISEKIVTKIIASAKELL
jgi:CspA family cold shock protein